MPEQRHHCRPRQLLHSHTSAADAAAAAAGAAAAVVTRV